jgi:hypothetical protein
VATKECALGRFCLTEISRGGCVREAGETFRISDCGLRIEYVRQNHFGQNDGEGMADRTTNYKNSTDVSECGVGWLVGRSE